MNEEVRRSGDKFIGFLAGMMLFLSCAAAWAWDPIRDATGRTLKEHVERKIEKGRVAARKFVRDPAGYLTDLPGDLINDICSAPMQQYEGTLRGQARTRWKPLPRHFVAALQSEYSVDLTSIRYAENIRTSNGQAQTFGRYIYFPVRIELRDRDDLFWMLHELEHSVQFAGARGGQSGKLCEYAMKSVGAGFEHDRIDMERAADRKADYLVEYAWRVMDRGFSDRQLRLSHNEIAIVNDTDRAVTFYLETRFTEETREVIPGRTRMFFEGSPRDTWFNVTVGKRLETYFVEGGDSVYIDVKRNGYLDLFNE